MTAEQINLLEAEADRCFDREDLVMARTKYKKLLKLRPSAKINNNLGMIAFYRGQLKLATNYFERAVKETTRALYWVNLGMAYAAQGQYDEAQRSYAQALFIDGDCWQALNASGSLYAERGQWKNAQGMFARAILLQPNNSDLLNNIANVLKFQGAYDEAYEHYRRALKIDPKNANLLYNLACLSHSRGDLDSAINYFERCLKIDSSNTSAAHLLAGLKGEITTSQAPQQYIRDLFDAYASTFDSNLTLTLDYHVPEILYSTCESYFQNKIPTFRHVLDLGCGTGLGGLQFAGKFEKMTGVDLSSAMLQLAVQHNIYADLVKDDISHFLETREENYDLFLACDVLIYIGDLEKVLEGVTKRAEQGAYFIFSVERYEGEQAYQLNPSGRYSHTREYLVQLAEQNGWNVEVCNNAQLRKDNDKWVEGLIFLLKKD